MTITDLDFASVKSSFTGISLESAEQVSTLAEKPALATALQSAEQVSTLAEKPALATALLPWTANVADMIVEHLEREGVQYIFGVPGGSLVPFFEALDRRGTIKTILSKHESGGSFMADGYARASRKIGVCCGIAGPGTTNAITGIACAHADSVPLLFISGQVSTAVFGRGALQESTAFGLDTVVMLQPATKLSTMIVDAQMTSRTMQQAFRSALSGRPGAVHINLPINISKQPAAATPSPRPRASMVTNGGYDPASIRNLATLLSSARQPCILAGHGINVAGAWEELRHFAERFKIPVATTPKAKGAMPENHELSLGVLGFGGHSWAKQFICSDAVDVLLVIGSSMGDFQTDGWDPRLSSGKIIVQIDIDPTRTGMGFPDTIPISADARLALGALEQELLLHSPVEHQRPSDPLAEVRRRSSRYLDAEKMLSEATPLKPQRLVHGMQKVLPDDALLFMDNGNCMSWVMHYYEMRRANCFYTNQGLASMGWAIPAAIGAQVAVPDRVVVAVCGDGAFGMSATEIHSAAEYDLPVICVVLNDGGFGMVEHGDTLVCGRPICPSRYKKPMDIAKISEGLGATSFRVSTPREFDEAMAEALKLRKTSVIDATICRNEVPATLKMRTDVLRTMFSGKTTS